MSPARPRATEMEARTAAVMQTSISSANEEPRRSATAQERRSADPQIRNEPDDWPASVVPTAASPRTRPVRVTVELAPVEHRQLRRLCEQYADDLGLSQVAGAEVVRALLTLMGRDERLAARVGAELRRSGGSRRRR